MEIGQFEAENLRQLRGTAYLEQSRLVQWKGFLNRHGPDRIALPKTASAQAPCPRRRSARYRRPPLFEAFGKEYNRGHWHVERLGITLDSFQRRRFCALLNFGNVGRGNAKALSSLLLFKVMVDPYEAEGFTQHQLAFQNCNSGWRLLTEDFDDPNNKLEDLHDPLPDLDHQLQSLRADQGFRPSPPQTRFRPPTLPVQFQL
ncbi:MAG: hypothetical protein QHC67_16740 [Sphingobium sp.]|nr:hypothetical protein [Sphingobium sp.]MDX3911436.1 hypothetical protein [Sphingobium sp.]